MKHDLLFSILAAQNDLIKTDELIEIGSAWAANPAKGLKERIGERVSADDMELLERLVVRALEKHGGDIERSIRALNADELLFKTLGGAVKLEEPKEEEGCACGDPICEKITLESPGRYTIKEEKNRGGIGKIFLAFDEHIGREIAVKELLCEGGGTGSQKDSEGKTPSRPSKALKARFLREARVTGQLEHPSIMTVYEIGQRLDGTCYYTMPFVRGITLLQAIRANPEPADRLNLLPRFHDLCNAMAYAHSKGVVHRDIKSENVMIGEFGETVVLDWGLAKIHGQSDIGAEKLEKGLELLRDAEAGKTVAGHAMGTPAYMPPEQAMGEIEEIDEKSDIYSLGAVLYEILTGQPPHTGLTAFDVIAKVLNDPIVRADERDKRIPRDLAAIAEKALSRRKEDRYVSAVAMNRDVEAYLTGGKVGAYEYSRWEIVKLIARKHKPLVVAVGAIIGVLLVATTVIYRNYTYALRQEAMAERSLKEAEASEAESQRNLADAYLDRAGNFLAARDYLSAEMYAALSLHVNPENPYSPNCTACDKYLVDDPGESLPDSIVNAQSILYHASMHGQVSYMGMFAKGGDAVLKAAFSPDGKLLATAHPLMIRLWDARERKLIREYSAYGWVWSLAFSPDGKTLAAGSYGTTVQTYDVTDKSPYVSRNLMAATKTATLGKLGNVFSLDFSPDGKYLAVGCARGEVALLDPHSLISQKMIRVSKGSILAVQFAKNGTELRFATSQGTMAAMSVPGLNEIDNATLLENGKDAHFRAMATDPESDDTFLATGAWIYRYRRGAQPSFERFLRIDAPNQAPSALRLLPGGLLTVGAMDGRIRFYDVAWKRILQEIMAHEQFIADIAVAPKGSVIVSVSQEDLSAKAFNITALIRKQTGAVRRTTRKDEGFGKSIWASDWHYRAECDDNRIDIYKAGKPESLWATFRKGKETNCERFSFPSDPHYFVATNGKEQAITLYDLVAKKEMKTHFPIPPFPQKEGPYCWDISKDQKRLAIASHAYHHLAVFDIDSGALLFDDAATFKNHIFSVAFGPNANEIAASERRIVLFDISGKRKIREMGFSSDYIYEINISPDGETLVAVQEKVLKAYQYATGKPYFSSQGNSPFMARLSSDSTMFLSVHNDLSVKFWTVKGFQRQTFQPSDYYEEVGFSGYGKEFYVEYANEIVAYPMNFNLWRKRSAELLYDVSRRSGTYPSEKGMVAIKRQRVAILYGFENDDQNGARLVQTVPGAVAENIYLQPLDAPLFAPNSAIGENDAMEEVIRHTTFEYVLFVSKTDAADGTQKVLFRLYERCSGSMLVQGEATVPAEGTKDRYKALTDAIAVEMQKAFSPEQVGSRLSSALPKTIMRECYERALQFEPELAGKLNLSFTTLPDGRMAKINYTEGSDIRSPRLLRCLEKRLSQYQFPPTGEESQWAVPLIFSPYDPSSHEVDGVKNLFRVRTEPKH